MSNEEFNSIYERSMEAIKMAELPDSAKKKFIEMMSRIEGFVDAGELTDVEAVDLIKQIVVGTVLADPVMKPQQKANA